MKRLKSKRSNINKYQGVPRSENPKELKKWQKFLTKIFPWFEKKFLLGDRYIVAEVESVEAEVDLKRAQARKLNAEADEIGSRAYINMEMAKKIAMEAKVMEDERIQDIDFTIVSEEEIENQLDTIERKVRDLYAIYGVKVNIAIQENNNDIDIKTEQKTVKGEDVESIKKDDDFNSKDTFYK